METISEVEKIITSNLEIITIETIIIIITKDLQFKEAAEEEEDKVLEKEEAINMHKVVEVMNHKYLVLGDKKEQIMVINTFHIRTIDQITIIIEKVIKKLIIEIINTSSISIFQNIKLIIVKLIQINLMKK